MRVAYWKFWNILAGHYGGNPRPYSGTVGITPADTISAGTDKMIYAILVVNTHTTNNLEVSWDSGTTWYPITPTEKSLSIDCEVASFQVRGSGAGTTYKGLVVEG